MKLKASWEKHTLNFKFNAGTSRGVLTQKDTWFIKVYKSSQPEVCGVGEAGPLKGLSIDYRPDFEDKLTEVCEALADEYLDLEGLMFSLDAFPSIKFALETALLDLENGGQRIIFKTPFSQSQEPIPINGLIWMGDKEWMLNQIEEKLADGFTCLKLKIGALNFETECEVLRTIRKRFSKEEVVIRVDANGAYKKEEAKEKLKILSEFEIHSIEQPIKPGQEEAMRKLCKENLLPIALDEELIGKNLYSEKKLLLESIKPQFIILKPTLLGGMAACKEWIELSVKLGIGWWITSALEANIGLNAISQFTSTYSLKSFPQGLGTGKLYHNNIPSPLVIKEGNLIYDNLNHWDLKIINNF